MWMSLKYRQFFLKYYSLIFRSLSILIYEKILRN